MGLSFHRSLSVLIALTLMTMALSIALPVNATPYLALTNEPDDGVAGRLYEYYPEFNKEAVITHQSTNAHFLSWDGQRFKGTPSPDDFGYYHINIKAETLDGSEEIDRDLFFEIDTVWEKVFLTDVESFGKFSVVSSVGGGIHSAYIDEDGILKHMVWEEAWSSPFSLVTKTGSDPITQTLVSMDPDGYPHIAFRNSSGTFHLQKTHHADDISSWYDVAQIAPIASGSLVSMAIDEDEGVHVLLQQFDTLNYYRKTGGSFTFVTSTTGVDHADMALDTTGNPHIVFTSSTDGWKVKHATLVFDAFSPSDVYTQALLHLSNPRIAIDLNGIHLIFRENQSGDGTLKYATNDGMGWSIENVLGPGPGNYRGLDLALASDGTVHISATNNNLGVLSVKLEAGTWDTDVVENLNGVNYQISSIVMENGESPYIFYPRGTTIIHAYEEEWAPSFTNAPEDGYVGDEYTYTPTFNEEVDILAYQTSADFLVWDDVLKRYQGTPGEDDAGMHWINITAKALYGGTSNQNSTFTIKVEYAPQLTIVDTPGSVQVDSEYRSRLSSNESVIWAFNTDAAFLSNTTSLDNPTTTIRVEGTPEESDIGTYWLNFTATSPQGRLTTYHNQTLTVYGFWAPEITSTPVTSVMEGSSYTYVLAANESVEWDLDGDANFLTLYQNNQTIHGTPIEGQSGEYQVNISATSLDGKLTTYQNFTFTVNEPWSPMITSSTDTVQAQVTFTSFYNATANESVVWTYESNAASFVTHEGNGNFTLQPTYGNEGTYYLNITATSIDGTASSHLNLTIDVKGVWRPDWEPLGEWMCEETFQYFSALKADQDVVWHVEHNIPVSLTIETNETTLNISGTPNIGDAGTYFLNVTAISVEGKLDKNWNYTFDIHQTPIPEFTSQPPTSVRVGHEFYYKPMFNNVSDDDFHLDTDSTFITRNEHGDLTGEAGIDDLGIWYVNFTVTLKSNNQSAYQNFTVTVYGWAPEIGLAPPEAREGMPYEHQFQANESVVWIVDFNMPGDWDLEYGDTTLNLTGSVDGPPGVYWINLTALSEDGGLAAVENFTFTILPSWAPTLDNLPLGLAHNTSFLFTPQYNESVTILVAETNAPFLTWNGTSQSFEGTPSDDDIGTWWIRLVAVSDAGGLENERNITISLSSQGEGMDICATPFVFFILIGAMAAASNRKRR